MQLIIHVERKHSGHLPSQAGARPRPDQVFRLWIQYVWRLLGSSANVQGWKAYTLRTDLGGMRD